MREVGDRGGAVGVGEADQERGGAVNGADGGVVSAWRPCAVGVLMTLIGALGGATACLLTTHRMVLLPWGRMIRPQGALVNGSPDSCSARRARHPYDGGHRGHRPRDER
mgnify:CR=1 FL=1